ELSARGFDLRLVCVSPYWPAACGKAALRGLTHDSTRSSPAPSKDLLHRRGHPHMTLERRPMTLFSKDRRCSGGLRSEQHAEQVARLVGIRQQVELLIERRAEHVAPYPAQRRKVLDGEADGVEKCDLARAPPSLGLAGDDLPQFGDRVVGRQLLDLA